MVAWSNEKIATLRGSNKCDMYWDFGLLLRKLKISVIFGSNTSTYPNGVPNIVIFYNNCDSHYEVHVFAKVNVFLPVR